MHGNTPLGCNSHVNLHAKCMGLLAKCMGLLAKCMVWLAKCMGLLAKHMGKKRIIAETGAGQHGVATASVAARHGLECIIYMGEEDIKRQSLNVFRIKLLGAKVVGKCMMGSTSNALDKGGENFKKLYYDSDVTKRNRNG